VFNRSRRAATLRRQLPATLLSRLHSILACDKAQLLWATKQGYAVTPEIRASLLHLLAYTTNSSNPWDVPLGLIVPRDHHVSSRGDASFAGGGAYCSAFRFWFDVVWSCRTVKGATRTKPSSDGCVHINVLEFIVVILQFAAIITRLEDCEQGLTDFSVYFPNGTPDIPVWLVESDNMVSVAWNKRPHLCPCKDRASSPSTLSFFDGGTFKPVATILLVPSMLSLMTSHAMTFHCLFLPALKAVQGAPYAKYLGLFPAKSQASTPPYREAVLQTQPGAMLTPNSARTVSTRRLHYLYFCCLMKWTDNWLLIGDEPDLPIWGQLQLAMYAVHLATGNSTSIYCKRIKATTVDSYVLAASTFLAFFTGRDFCKDLPTDSSLGHLLGPVLRDLRSYQSVPNRGEPYDLNMHILGRDLVLLPDSKALLPALIDGFEQGLCAGYRLSEWAQPIGKYAIDRPQLNHMISSPHRTLSEHFDLLSNEYIPIFLESLYYT